MLQIRYQTIARNASFPAVFDRIHLSNVPDYVYVLCSYLNALPS